MDQIIMQPIGIIHSPYKEAKNIPIQGIFNTDIEAWIELKDEFANGLKSLDKFSHAISHKEWKLKESPFSNKRNMEYSP